MKDRNSILKFEYFEIPRYICGRSGVNFSSMESNNQNERTNENGIIILEDLSAKDYGLVDPDYMMLNLEEMTVQ